MMSRLAPAGEQISLEQTPLSQEPLSGLLLKYEGYHSYYFQSGTASLAVAMSEAKHRFCGGEEGEVVMPAYACPDLVSAAVYAGLTPVLVDLNENSYRMDLDQLKNLLNEKTVAIVAVNFLGLAEDKNELAEITAAHGIALIEDNAQSYPGVEQQYRGDFVVMSFGRGKPISLLGGGAVFSRDKILMRLEDGGPKVLSGWQKLIAMAKVLAYNAMIRPFVYGMISSLPFLRLGETRYSQLNDIRRMDDLRSRLLPGNILSQLSDARLSAQQKIADILEPFSPAGVVDLTKRHTDTAEIPLLRYPVLLPSQKVRDALMKASKLHGLGFSMMYKTVLPDIESVGPLVRYQGELKYSHELASCLITIPVHSFVKQAHLEKIRQVFVECID